MFFCDPCAETLQYPVSMFKSYGTCEICQKPARCNEVGSAVLAALPQIEAFLADPSTGVKRGRPQRAA